MSSADEVNEAAPRESSGAEIARPFLRLLGGLRGAMESILPPAVFVGVYLGLGGNAEEDLTWAIIASIGLGLIFTVWRLAERKHPARALGSILLVLVSAYIASRTGSAVDFFWPRVLLNAASALAFLVANLAGWPLIGVILGPLVGTRMRWRDDPVLMRAYKRASWPWVLLNVVRTVLLVVFIDGDNLWALAVSGAFFYGLTIITIIASWWLIRRTLNQAGHPGIRHAGRADAT